MLRTLLGRTGVMKQFCFFDKQISQGYGKKCCRYGQDGKPMPEKQARQLFNNLNTYLKGWQLVEDCRKLKKYYYIEDYPKAHEFLSELVGLDAHQFKQCPSYHVTNGQILEIQVYSITLKGLSMVDFQLAMRINNIPFSQYYLLQLKDVENYRKEVSKVKMAREAQRIQKMLAQDEKNWGKDESKEQTKQSHQK